MRTRMRMILPVASVALLTATVGAAAATASSTGPAASPSASKSSGAAVPPGKTPPGGGCGGGTVTKTPPPPGTPDQDEVRILAGILHVGQDQAARILEQVQQIAAKDDGITPGDPAFVALAQSLHMTAQHLIDALTQMKQELIQLMPKPSDSSKPAPSPGQS